MNDLPQNELLTAYLDGELTAAEQAETERLLAESPAARQLLEELSPCVICFEPCPGEAHRRFKPSKCCGGRTAHAHRREPGAADDGPMTPAPLGRTFFRRFVNRRTMTWLTLTAAIALIFAISDWRRGVPPIAEGEKKVALVSVHRREVPFRHPAAGLPTMQALRSVLPLPPYRRRNLRRRRKRGRGPLQH